jgi:insertion element IS1 protein InsB
VIEMDELCVRFSPALWLWIAVSRMTRLVVGSVIADRGDDALLRLLEEEMHPAWRDLPIKTDGWEAYRRLIPTEQHEVCAKTSGKTSIVEALNCKWRHRQSGLARKSCGVSRRITDDLTERFLILVDRHNRQCLKRWQKAQTARQDTRSSP